MFIMKKTEKQGNVLARSYTNVVVRKLQCRVQLNHRHVATDAIPALPLVTMPSRRRARMTRIALLVIESRIIPFGIQMRRMTRRASQLARRETPALHQPQRLKTNVFHLPVVNRRRQPVAPAA
jgi:hypothetical protein